MKYRSDRIVFKAILLFALLSFIPQNAYAADKADTAVYTPTSAWLVGPASLDSNSDAASAGKMPCVVANQYSNGYVVRFSGGGDTLMAMAIDFRQKVFTPRQKYEVEFSVPGKFFQTLSGAAYDEGTLLFSLYKMPDFYKAIQKADTLTIKAAGTTIALNMAGLNDGFRRMNDCYDPDKITNTQKAAAVISPRDTARQNPLLQGGLTPMPGETSPPEPAAVAAASPGRPDPEASVNAVLSNGGDVSPAGGSASLLIARAKEAQQAAQRLAAASPANDKNNNGVPMTGTWSQARPIKPLRPNGSEIMVQNGTQATGNATQDQRWRAVKGGDLHDVLSSWTAGAGVKLMWLAQKDFMVQRSLSVSGTFQQAVQQLLEGYANERLRPTGRIYHEPGSTQLVLVIEQAENKSE
ncbi:MAG: hypothetical protein JWO78_1020 [Micavibrio sp.]|nr:hypothetical protein [Micavibrio sp.]